MTHPMASQMAQLLVDSDVEELEEVVARWTKDAPTESVRSHYQRLGAHLLQLKRQLASLPRHPSREDLEAALSMMMGLAEHRSGR